MATTASSSLSPASRSLLRRVGHLQVGARPRGPTRHLQGTGVRYFRRQCSTLGRLSRRHEVDARRLLRPSRGRQRGHRRHAQVGRACQLEAGCREFGGDAYHLPWNHRSAFTAGFAQSSSGRPVTSGGRMLSPGNGNSLVMVAPDDPTEPPVSVLEQTSAPSKPRSIAGWARASKCATPSWPASFPTLPSTAACLAPSACGCPRPRKDGGMGLGLRRQRCPR